MSTQKKSVPTTEEIKERLKNRKSFLQSLTPEQLEIAFNAPDEAETFGKSK